MSSLILPKASDDTGPAMEDQMEPPEPPKVLNQKTAQKYAEAFGYRRDYSKSLTARILKQIDRS